MTTRKKLFLSISLSILPIATFATVSCNSGETPQKPTNPWDPEPINDPFFAAFRKSQEPKWKAQEEIQKIYDKLEPKFKDLVTINVFNTPTTSFNGDKILGGPYYMLNMNFFQPVDASKKVANWTKIQTKEEFDQIIIKRFQELNNRDDLIISETEIKEEFQKIFLKNQDVYEFLKTNDIYIDDDDPHTAFEYYHMVPFESDNSIELNIIDDVLRRWVTTDVIPYTTWAVFSLPKDKTVSVKRVSVEYRESESELEYLLNFQRVLLEWYNGKFKKHFNE